MTRQYPLFLHKSPPRYPRHFRSPKSSFKLPKRSANHRGHTGSVLAGTHNFSPELPHELRPAPEVDVDDGLKYRQVAGLLDDDDDDNESDGDLDMYEWDETTLYDHFLSDEVHEETERNKLISLANRLKAPFEAQNKRLKESVLHSYAPAAKRIKDVHAALDEKAEPALIESVCAFDDTCKEVEAESIAEEEDLKTAHSEFRTKIKNLLTNLEQTYAHLEKLWADFEADINHIAVPAIEDLRGLPAQVEQVIETYEIKSKKLDKENSESSKKNATLLELLDDI